MSKELTNLEKLAVLQAVYKQAASYVSTKDPNSLRSQTDRELKELYDKTGAHSFQINLNNKPVGSMALRFSKAIDDTVLQVIDKKAFEDWCLANGYAHTVEQVVLNREADELLAELAENGELPDGCEYEDIHEEPRFLGTTLKGCKPQDVQEALGAQLSQVIAGELNGVVDNA